MPKVPDVPWQTVILTMDKNDTRRDKRRCKYYRSDGTCKKQILKCSSSKNCSYYRENKVVEEPKQKEKIAPPADYYNQFPNNCRVKHTKFGKGLVLKHEKDGNNRRIIVRFDDGTTRKMNAEACAAGQLIRID